MSEQSFNSPAEKEEYVQKVLRKQPKQRIRADYGIRDLYHYYEETTIKDLRAPYEVFRDVIHDLNAAIVAELLKAKEIKLPCSVGYMRVKKTKMSYKDTNKLRIDWAATKKAGKKMYHLNEHRGGHRYRFYWLKNVLDNRGFYSFIPTRQNKRALAHILKTDFSTDYFE